MVDPQRNPLPEDHIFRQIQADTFARVLLRFYNIMQGTSKSVAVHPDLKKEVADKLLKEKRDGIRQYHGEQMRALLESLDYMVENAERMIVERKFPENSRGNKLVVAQEFNASRVVEIETLPCQQ